VSEFKASGGVARIIRAFGYSLQGLRACLRHEAAFRQEALVGLVVIPLGLWLGEGGAEKVLLAGSWILVMIVELLNSAVEATVDRFGPERHTLSGRAKDIGSAAVLVAIVLSILVWVLILAPRVA
jgi:diacylglycerol kinase (ATP)